MNITILKGNITRDLEVTFTPKGTAVCEIGLAVNDVWFNDAGEKQEEVTFLDCRAWGRAAEAIGKNFYKGKPILIHGKLKQERWEDKETGKKRSKTLIIVQHWEFCGDVRGAQRGEDKETRSGGDGERSPARPAPPQRAESAEEMAGGFEEDDIPF